MPTVDNQHQRQRQWQGQPSTTTFSVVLCRIVSYCVTDIGITESRYYHQQQQRHRCRIVSLPFSKTTPTTTRRERLRCLAVSIAVRLLVSQAARSLSDSLYVNVISLRVRKAFLGSGASDARAENTCDAFRLVLLGWRSSSRRSHRWESSWTKISSLGISLDQPSRPLQLSLGDIITALIINDMCEGVLMYEGLVMFETGSLVTHSCRLFCEVPAEPYSQDLSSPFLPSLLKFWVCVKGGSERLRARCWKCAIGKH